ncbi:hypothetical protein JCM11251_001029 [Rhodosporidiobolus azoricus]
MESRPLSLYSLPPEILTHALAHASPRDCAAFSRTSRASHSLCQSASLWRALHRARWDPPIPSGGAHPLPSSPGEGGTATTVYDYATQVKRRARTETLLVALASTDDPKPIPPAEHDLVLSTLVDLAESRLPVTDPASRPSQNEAFLETHLAQTSPTLLALHPSFSRSSLRALRSSTKSSSDSDPPTATATATAFHLSQLASHLTVLSSPSPLLLSTPSILTSARETVYEKSNYTRLNAWGPFLPDGSGKVDWRVVEAVAVVMGSELGDAVGMGWGTEGEREGDETRVPRGGWEVSRPGGARTVKGRDWAGIEGKEWRGTYAFLHWPIWYHFNFHRPSPAFLLSTPPSRLPPPNSLAEDPSSLGDPMTLRLSLLPEGEWPKEIDVPDLSRESLEAAVEAEEEEGEERDGEWSAERERARGRGVGEGGSSASESEEGSGEDWGYSEDEGDEGEIDLDDFLRHSHHHRQGSDRHAHAHAHPSSTSSSSPPTSPPNPPLASPHPPPGYPGPLPSPPPRSSDAPLYPGMQLTFAPPPPPPPSADAPCPSASSGPADPFPPLAFSGTTRPTSSLHHPHRSASSPLPSRTIRGVVLPTPCRSTRFHAVIHDGGQDQWNLEGVVVSRGGRMGVLGVWTGAERAEEGPCGPFWYWPHDPDADPSVEQTAAAATTRTANN